jgi:hypothetical protein
VVNFPDFFRDRRKVAAIVIAILAIIAILAVTWVQAPDLWTSAGLRRDPKLTSYIDTLHALVIEQHPQNLTSWRVTWLNNTAVKVTWGYTYYGAVNASAGKTVNATESTAANTTGNQTQLVRYDESFVMTNFFSTRAASAYVNLTKSNYTLMNTTYYRGGAYQQAFGSPPATFADYKQVRGAQGNFIWQFDQFVQAGSCQRTYAT